MIVTKEQIARAYALMECERAQNRDNGYGHYPAISHANRFLEMGLIEKWEYAKFVNNEYPHSYEGPFREAFLDIFALYEHQNPLPSGKRYTIELKHCFPVSEEINRNKEIVV